MRAKRKTEATLTYSRSLRIKKVKGEVLKGYSNIFEGRITRDYRFFFLIETDAYILLRCGRHEEFLR